MTYSVLVFRVSWFQTNSSKIRTHWQQPKLGRLFIQVKVVWHFLEKKKFNCHTYSHQQNNKHIEKKQQRFSITKQLNTIAMCPLFQFFRSLCVRCTTYMWFHKCQNTLQLEISYWQNRTELWHKSVLTETIAKKKLRMYLLHFT